MKDSNPSDISRIYVTSSAGIERLIEGFLQGLTAPDEAEESLKLLRKRGLIDEPISKDKESI